MIIILIGVGFLWLLILTWTVIKTRQHYLNLCSKTKKNKLDEILDQLLENEKIQSTDLDSIKKNLRILEENSKSHFQKIGLVRFNPFERTGGEQSFVIAILNRQESGILINYIYTRDGLRVYTKKVLKGTGEKYELTVEEKEAIKKSV